MRGDDLVTGVHYERLQEPFVQVHNCGNTWIDKQEKLAFIVHGLLFEST